MNRQTRFGWQLVVGLIVFACMTAILGEVAEDVITGQPLTVTDAKLSNWLHTHRTHQATAIFVVVTTFGSTLAGSLVALTLGIYLIWRQQKYWLTVSMVAIFGGMLLNRLLKHAFQRARPQFDDPIFSFTGYSFPSGHTMTATVVYGTLAAALLAYTKNKTKRVAILAATALMIALVGFSRIYLGAHYLSDVLGAIAEGVAWLSLCVTTAYYLKLHLTQRPKCS